MGYINMEIWTTVKYYGLFIAICLFILIAHGKSQSTTKNVSNSEEIQESSGIENNHMVKCPKCGSTQIQLVTRKWSLLTGFFTNKVDRVCVNCKNKF